MSGTLQLSGRQECDLAGFHTFVAEEIVPHADLWDREECLPRELVAELGRRGYLGAAIPAEAGGSGLDAITLSLLHEAMGYGCSSVRCLLTVHSMVAHAIARWGNEHQKGRWLPGLASGEIVAAFALTEPEAGSDATSVRATATRRGPHYVLEGEKRWVTYGQRANLFLVFARCDDQVGAFLVERDSEGLEIVPTYGLLGTKASMVATLHLRGCEVPADGVLGRIGFGIVAVASSALELGRYSVACGCAGSAQACVDSSIDYVHQREQFGKRIAEHQLIQRMIADMVTNVSAARLLCRQAGSLRQTSDPRAVLATWVAKYFASRSAFQAAADAVQIHGANGCSDAYPVQRLLRDAKVMEIIEGTSEIQQVMIARSAYGQYQPSIL